MTKLILIFGVGILVAACLAESTSKDKDTATSETKIMDIGGLRFKRGYGGGGGGGHGGGGGGGHGGGYGHGPGAGGGARGPVYFCGWVGSKMGSSYGGYGK